MDCTQLSIAPTIINSAFAVVILWLMARSYWQHRIDIKFGCSRFGGRGGHITIRHNGRSALVEFEIGGKDVDLIIYEGSLKWIGANQMGLTPDDRNSLLTQLSAWCKASKCKVELVPQHVA